VARYVAGTPVEAWPWALAIAAAVLAVGAVLFAFDIMGGGDVKLLAVCVLWAGPALAPSFILLTALVGGALALLYLMWGRYVAPALQLRAFSAIPNLPAGAGTGGGQILPYGVAIAVSGLFVVAELLGV
jgi:prepilin peptidase CpaA